MRVLLANLPWVVNGKWGVRAGSRWPHIKDLQTEGDYQPYPFYLGYSASLLLREDFEVKLIDCLAEKITTGEFLRKVDDFNPDFIFSEVSTISLKNDLEILSKVKNYPIGIGGADLSIRRKDFLEKFDFINYVLFGEYEITLWELLKNIRKNKSVENIKGIIFKKDGEVIVNQKRELLKNLDFLPWPLREGMPMEKYIDAPGNLPIPSVQMWTSRGCPFRCIFCVWPQIMYGNNVYRQRDTSKVVDEMECLIKKMRFQSIYIDDDTTNVSKKRMKKLSEEILRRGLKFPWAIMARPDLMDEDVLISLRKAGLHSVKYGVESASQEILDRANKNMNLEKTIRMIKFTQELGIKTHLTFTFGLPGETKDTIKKTIDLALSLNPASLQFSIATPFPGTRFYEEMKEKGYILTDDFSLYDGNYKSVIRTENLEAEDLEEARRKAYEIWGKHLRKRESFRIPFEKRYIRTFSFYLKHYGIKSTLRKIRNFASFLIKHNLSKARNIFHSISSKRFYFLWNENNGRIFYDGKEVTQGVGLNLSFRVKNAWFDTSFSSPSLKKIFNKMNLRFLWRNLPLKFIFKVYPIKNGMNVKVYLKNQRKVRINELKILLHLSHRYINWFSEIEQGKFNKSKGWENIPLFHPWVKWISTRECGEGSSVLPLVSIEDCGEGNIGLELSPPEINTKILKISIPEKIFPYGSHYITEFNIRAGLSEDEAIPKGEERRSILHFIKVALKLEGVKSLLWKSIRHFKPSFYLEKFPDLVGVFNKRKAFIGPSFVQIDVTNMCNNECIGCWCNSPLLREKRMPEDVRRQTLSLSVVKELIDELKHMGCKEIYYSGGGEPFMHPDMLEIARYTKEKGITCYINTNFTLLNKRRMDELISIGVDHLTVSTWAGTGETYAKTHIGRTPKDFEKIREDLIYLNKNKKGKPLVKLYNVIFNMNYKEIEKMIEFAEETFSDSVEFTVIDTIPGYTDVLLLNEKEQEELIKICERVKKRRKNGWARGVVLFNFDQFLNRISNKENVTEGLYDKWIIGKIPCYIGWVFTRILPDGNVNGCLKAHRIPLGNIFKNKFSEIWNSEKYQNFRFKTLTFDKNDPFFSLIGNDPNQKVGCYKSCDDLQRNLSVHRKILSLSPFERRYMKFAVRFLEEKKREEEEEKDLILKGIKHGRKAFIGPEQVVIDLTNSCNQKCILCWTHSPYLKNPPPKEFFNEKIPPEILERTIKEFSEIGVKRVRFTGGGEPLVYPEVEKFMELVKEKDMLLCLTTNLFRVKRNIIERIKDEVDEIAVSLWAAKPETYSLLRPPSKKEDFFDILKNIEFISKGRGKLTIANVICNKNYKEMIDMVKIAKNVGADAIYFTLQDPMPGTEKFLLNEKELEEIQFLFDEIENEGIEIENWEGFKERIRNPLAKKGYYDKGRVDRIPCYVGWVFSRIMADSNVVPCCRAVKKVMGNLKEKNFKEIWYSEKYNEFRGKAKYLPKSNPYFDDIGCYLTCDNLMHNEEIHRRYKESLSKEFYY